MRALALIGWTIASQILAICGLLLAGVEAAQAHGTERGLVMLLPTGFAQVGGAIVVAVSFLIIAAVPVRWLQVMPRSAIPLWPLPANHRQCTSMASFAVLAALILIGLTATADPLENLLPLTIWTIWWVGLTLLIAVTGDLWPWLNPWTGPLARLRRVTGTAVGRIPLLRLPTGIGYAPAILLYGLFAWYELVSLSPQDPARLAMVVLAYWGLTLTAMILFGTGPWLQRGEPFSVFFRLIGTLAPLARRRHRRPAAGRNAALVWPGARALTAPALPLTGTLFVLLTLSSVSFDGFSYTFSWLGLIGINPLEFPGRSAVVTANTAGLIAAFLLLGGLFFLAVFLGNRLAGLNGWPATREMAGRLVYSVIPISIAFHICHYLPILLVNGQYFSLALTDPFSLGWEPFGHHHHVTTSFMSNIDDVTYLWSAQTALIVGGHVTGILLAHMISLQRFGSSARAALSQVPLGFAMVLYTVFGLWLLSTPVAG